MTTSHQQPATCPRTRANRANSQRSTGPRTPAGKQRSSLNALRHGLTAASALLPSEDRAAFEDHRRRFFDEYQPATPTESQLVQELADTSWRLNRIPALEAALFSQNPDPQTLIPLLGHARHARPAPLPPVPKDPRPAPRDPSRPRRARAPPPQRRRRPLRTPQTQRNSLGARRPWLRFFKRPYRTLLPAPPAPQPGAPHRTCAFPHAARPRAAPSRHPSPAPEFFVAASTSLAA